MHICLIQVPYTCGDAHHPASQGPSRFVQAGIEQLLSRQGIAVTVTSVDRDTPFHDSASTSLANCKQIAQRVRDALAADQFPIVVAGSCDVSKGVLAGFEHAHCGVIWFDAHGDFNTPETTITGFFPGMSLALITGHCYRNYWGQIGDSTPIAEAATLLLGARDLDPLEAERLHQSAIQVVAWREGKPQADVATCLDNLAQRVSEVYVHIDMDVLDPSIAPGTFDPLVAGGVSLPVMEEIIRQVAVRFRMRAASLATYNPAQDRADQTLQAGLRLIEWLGEYGAER